MDIPLLTAVINEDVSAAVELLGAATNGSITVDFNLVDSEHTVPPHL